MLLPAGSNATVVFFSSFSSEFLVVLNDVKLSWEVYDKVGKVNDVYTARKLSKLGKRFAFVRFLKVKDAMLPERKLRDIWIGSYHLFAFVARFSQDAKNGDKVDEGHENSFSMGNGVVDEELSSPNVAATRGAAVNQSNPIVPSPVMAAGCELQGNSPILVANVEGEGASESPS
ncbi:unnamed protein product [Lactuca saligna]|uniref:RRM domain-containing protein n=1 Tax=Lactuca saligna TaxID=75948 RepID=A0AA35ZK56_LACSI|nr:unnamed protein product [Lactuca saligna]